MYNTCKTCIILYILGSQYGGNIGTANTIHKIVIKFIKFLLCIIRYNSIIMYFDKKTNDQQQLKIE